MASHEHFRLPRIFHFRYAGSPRHRPQEFDLERERPAGTCTNFQIAASNNSSGPWNYLGPSGDASSYYGASCSQSPNGGLGCASTDTPICVNSSQFNNYRYYRYKAQLQSNVTQTQTPRVDDVILNFSR